MWNVDDFRALLRTDAGEAAKRTLRGKFGRLSNRRILHVLRPAADQIQELRGRSDAELLDEWFSAFIVYRGELQSRKKATPLA